MNIQNITALAAQLKAIGFDNMGYPLLKQICLAPTNFILTEKLSKVPENILFHFYFVKGESGEFYQLLHYDAVLQKEIVFGTINIEGVSVKGIDESMMQIDWKAVFDFSRQKSFDIEDKSSYETEVKIHQVICLLNKIEGTDEGKAISLALKQKHWSGISNQDIMGPVINGRNKSEVSQRFYFSEGQSVISADEAYRFLLNRWMEKQMQLKKKQHDGDGEAGIEESNSKSGSGLLTKRRIGNNKSNKRHKSAQD